SERLTGLDVARVAPPNDGPRRSCRRLVWRISSLTRRVGSSFTQTSMQHHKGCAMGMVVTLLSQQNPLFAARLSAKSGVHAGDVVSTLKRLLATKSAERRIGGRCGACAQWTLVYSPASRTRAVIVAA